MRRTRALSGDRGRPKDHSGDKADRFGGSERTRRMTAAKEPASRVAKKNRGSTQVPGQLYGYLLQVTRFVAHLLRAHPGQAVSVEHLDDVATEGPDGVIAEQDKSGLAHNPVSDRS